MTSNSCFGVDGGGLSDADEINVHCTDPLVADSDGEGLPDGDEVKLVFMKRADDSDFCSEHGGEQVMALLSEAESHSFGRFWMSRPTSFAERISGMTSVSSLFSGGCYCLR